MDTKTRKTYVHQTINSYQNIKCSTHTNLAFMKIIQPLWHSLKLLITSDNQLKKQDTLESDLTKAFDTVDHTILLDKLYHYQFRGLTLNWYKNYFLDKTTHIC